MKKGFTLIELLGVIIIIALLAMIVFPSIINILKKSSEEVDEATLNLIYKQSEVYIRTHIDEFPKISGNRYIINVDDLVSEDLIPSDVSLTNKEKLNDKCIQVIYENNYTYELTNQCIYYNKSLNDPILFNGLLTPVIYDGDNWKVADTSSKWYDYDKQWWANAVILKPNVSKTPGTVISVSGFSSDVYAMYVWIPRYEYKIEGTYGKGGTSTTSPGEIEINFISSDTIVPSDGYKINSGFTFGNTNLSGIWVGKFETSHATLSTSDVANNLNCQNENCSVADNLRIVPDVPALIYNNVSNFFFASRSMGRSGNAFGIDNTITDSHMMKNSEWGIVSYLSQSKYGKYGVNLPISGDLPSEYQQVEYIESTGTQYINTGYSPKSTTRFVKDVQYLSTDHEQEQGSTNSSYGRCFLGIANSKFSFGMGSLAFPSEIDADLLRHKQFAYLDSGTYGIDDTVLSTTFSFGSSTSNIYLFARNLSNVAYLHATERLFSATIQEGTTMIRNFIPCYRKSDGVIGMYDTVNGVFYTNSGSGTFVKGENIKAIEVYINNSAKHYTGRSGGAPGGSTPINKTYIGETSEEQYTDYGFYTYDDYLLNYNTNVKGSKVDGKGIGASTTGNIYGVYDMSGGSWDYVMGVFSNSSNSLWSGTDASRNSGFTGKLGDSGTNYSGVSFPDTKYYDVYKASNGTTMTNNQACNGGMCYGHAINPEVANWHGDNSSFISATYPWFVRGGSYNRGTGAGVMNGDSSYGSYLTVSFRLVLTEP